METVNGTSRNGSSTKGSWLAPATWSFDGTDLAIIDTGWVDLVHRKPSQVLDDAVQPAVDLRSCPPPDDLAAERARLETEIASAKARAAAAKVRVAIRDAKVQAALGTEFDAARESLAAMESQHELAIEQVRADSKAEVARILAEARVHDAD